MEIKEKLFNIQQELKVEKSQFNAFGKYKYRSCEDILSSVKPILEKYKCILLLTDQIENIGDRYYIKATATLNDVENDGYLGVSAFAREELTKKGMDGSQITGTSSSYARKYALNGLFAIDDTKDSDATNTGNNTQVRSAPRTDVITKDMYEELSKLCKLANKVETKSMVNLPRSDFAKVKAALLKEVRKAAENVQE
mgnify:CR=1 FL=1